MTQLQESPPGPPHLLNLPGEIRNLIFQHLFFPIRARNSIEEIVATSEESYTVYPNLQCFQWTDVSIMQTCRQLSEEGRSALYSNLVIDLDYDGTKPNRHYLDGLLHSISPRNLGLIRHIVSFSCFLTDDDGFYPAYQAQPTICEWTRMINFIALKCHSLRTLTIRTPFTCNMDLPECSIPMSFISTLAPFKELKDISITFATSSLTNELQPFQEAWATLSPTQSNAAMVVPKAFRFLDLPAIIRRRVYLHLLLPDMFTVHPLYPPHMGDKTTQNLIPLFLTCHQIHQEAEETFYSTAIFSACVAQDRYPFLDFMDRRTARQLGLMKRYNFRGRKNSMGYYAFTRAIPTSRRKSCFAFMHPAHSTVLYENESIRNPCLRAWD